MSSLADLLDLQAVDAEIDRLLQERQDLPALTSFKHAHEAWQSLVDERTRIAAQAKQHELDLDKTSGELEIAENKLAAEQNRLYAGGLSARDADYMRREVEMLTRKNEAMEDEVLQLMELRDAAGERLEELDAQIEQAAKVKDGLEAQITEAWREIDARLARKEARKADIVPLIDVDLLDLYERLRKQKEDGWAVGRLADGTCGACHLRLTRAEQLEAQRSDPPRCIHCRAILVP